MFEVLGQKVSGEFGWVPHDEAVVGGAPRHDRVGGRVFHHVVSLAQKRRRRVGVRNRRRRSGPTAIHVGKLNLSNKKMGEKRIIREICVALLEKKKP